VFLACMKHRELWSTNDQQDTIIIDPWQLQPHAKTYIIQIYRDSSEAIIVNELKKRMKSVKITCSVWGRILTHHIMTIEWSYWFNIAQCLMRIKFLLKTKAHKPWSDYWETDKYTNHTFLRTENVITLIFIYFIYYIKQWLQLFNSWASEN